jgi:superfamily II DNA or RNA helicase
MWPIQESGVRQTLAAIEAREFPIVLTSPTGTGKTRMMAEICYPFIGMRKRVAIYTNRNWLIQQMSNGMKALGLEHDFRASEKPETSNHLMTIISVQTEDVRTSRVPKLIKELDAAFEAGEIENDEYYGRRYCLEKKKRDFIDCDLVILDEGHLMTGATVRRIISHYIVNEVPVVLVTATPIGLNFAKKLVIAGKTSDGRGCGALVWARHHGCDEPDLKALKINPAEEVSEATAVKAVMTAGIFGRVLDHWKRLNPEQHPTLLFAAGVRESIWFAEQFRAEGIRAAHIDGDDIWLDGEFEPTSESGRESIIEQCRDGDIKVICNRFVLREGIDLPFIRHGILATMFGSLPSYLQACGRLLRADRGDHGTVERFGPKEWATIQDHGGHWWRLGSVNMDRPWELGLPSSAYVGMLHQRMREKPDEQPKTCPTCGLVMVRGMCPKCNKEVKTGRIVVQHDGQLKEHVGPIFAPRKELLKPNTQQLWDRCYWGAKKGAKGMTFNQAIGWFMTKYHYWPVRTLNHMPFVGAHFYRKVKSVKREDLRRCHNPRCTACNAEEPVKPAKPAPQAAEELF